MTCRLGAPLLLFIACACHQTSRADSFLYSNGTFSTIQEGDALGINDRGQIVGSFPLGEVSYLGAPPVIPIGPVRGFFLNTNNAFSTIDAPSPPFPPFTPYSPSPSTAPRALNDSGQIVGTVNAGQTSPTGLVFLDTNGVFTQIPVPTTGFAGGINNAGQIVGGYASSGFLYSNGSLTTIQVPGSTFTAAAGINNHDEIVGTFVDAAGKAHSFLDINGVFTTIDYPGSIATTSAAINDEGQIVGEYLSSSSGDHGFIDNNGSFETFDAPGAAFTAPEGINDRGQIVGIFQPVPEPASALLFTSWLVAIGIMLACRRTIRPR